MERQKLGRAIKSDGCYKLYKFVNNGRTSYELHFVYKKDSTFLGYVSSPENFAYVVDEQKEEMAWALDDLRAEFGVK